MSRSAPLQRKPDRERGDVDLVLVMATLGVLVWVLGPWLVAIVQALDATEELTQVAWSLARRAELTATPPPPTVTVPGLGEVQVDWRGTLGRCGMVTVVARSALPLPLALTSSPPAPSPSPGAQRWPEMRSPTARRSGPAVRSEPEYGSALVLVPVIALVAATTIAVVAAIGTLAIWHARLRTLAASCALYGARALSLSTWLATGTIELSAPRAASEVARCLASASVPGLQWSTRVSGLATLTVQLSAPVTVPVASWLLGAPPTVHAIASASEVPRTVLGGPSLG